MRHHDDCDKLTFEGSPCTCQHGDRDDQPDVSTGGMHDPYSEDYAGPEMDW